MSAQTCVVHLVWAPLGTEPLRRFVDAYARHPAGIDHRLLVVYNGFTGRQDRSGWEQELASVPHESLATPAPMLDLAAYRYAVEERPAGCYCFLNSYSAPLADGWLAMLADALEQPRVGLAAATGSWASRSSHMRFSLRLGGPYARLLGSPGESSRAFRALASPGEAGPHKRLRTALSVPWTLVGFPRFPAPHLRTNGFAVSADVWRSIPPRPLRRKLDSHLLESGRHSLTATIEAAGLRAVVVGRDGAVYEPQQWPSSDVFWQHDQENLLIADNQTIAYQQGSAEQRTLLSRLAWGTAARPAPPPAGRLQ